MSRRQEHQAFNRAVLDAAIERHDRARQDFRERFNQVMGYYPNISDERDGFLGMLGTVPARLYEVGSYWLAAFEEDGTAYLILEGFNDSVRDPADFVKMITDYKE